MPPGVQLCNVLVEMAYSARCATYPVMRTVFLPEAIAYSMRRWLLQEIHRERDRRASLFNRIGEEKGTGRGRYLFPLARRQRSQLTPVDEMAQRGSRSAVAYV